MKKIFIICLGVSTFGVSYAFSAAREETKDGSDFGHSKYVGKSCKTPGEVLMEKEMDITMIRANAELGEDWAIVEMFERSLSGKNPKEAVEWAVKGFSIHDIFYTLAGHNPRIGEKGIEEAEKRRLIDEYVNSVIKKREESPFKE